MISAAVLTTFIATRMFGHTELRLLATRIHGVGRSLVEFTPRRETGTDTQIRLQGTRSWEAAWESLVEAVVDMPVRRIDLDLNAPRHHEGFHATWKRTKVNGDDRVWRFEMPLIAAGREAGRIRVVGDRLHSGSMQEFEKVVLLLESFETQVSDMLPREGTSGDSESGYAPSRRELRSDPPVAIQQPALHSMGGGSR